MVKKKRIISKLILALVVLTAISCCFLGSTFARYTSGGSGSATVTIAEWNIAFTTDGSTPLIDGADIIADSTQLSPSMDAWATSNTRSHSTAKAKIVITNSGDVSATVTVDTADTVTVTKAEDANYGKAAISSENYTSKPAPTEAQVQGLFSVSVTYNSSDPDGAEAASATADATAGGITLAPDETLNLFVCITWTSADDLDEGQSTNGAVADYLDTWVGENITKVASTVTYTAVQASELPNA